jgi:ribosomal protein S18 acetylase RimI-like enzyme
MNFFDEQNEILFQTMQSNDIEKTATCIAQVFSNHEPLATSLNISFDEFYHFVFPICQKAASEQLSIIAKDEKTGEVVGFIIANNFMTINSKPLEIIDNKFEAVFSLLSELEEKYLKANPNLTKKVLCIFMLGVQKKYTHRHIATTLVRENLNLAKYHNFKIAITEATSIASQNIFRKLGFNEEFAIEYDSHNFQGKKVFSSIKNQHNCLLMSSNLN